MLLRITLFLIINFAALGVGSLFTKTGVSSEWYANLNKAPWTPAGWIFGTAWTFIMIFFAIYMSELWNKVNNRVLLIILFAVQWILNVAWNPIFFHLHLTGWGLIDISLLTIVVGIFTFSYWQDTRWFTLLVMPYFIWLIIATSLNGYVFFQN